MPHRNICPGIRCIPGQPAMLESRRRRWRWRRCRCSVRLRLARGRSALSDTQAGAAATPRITSTKAADRSPAPAAPAKPTDRMLGAIVPHGAQTWYFKMIGPMEAVASQGAAFRQLIESIRFENEQSPAAMDAPGIVAGERRDRPAAGDTGGGRGRPDVGSVGDSAGDLPVANSLLDNVNRWRGKCSCLRSRPTNSPPRPPPSTWPGAQPRWSICWAISERRHGEHGTQLAVQRQLSITAMNQLRTHRSRCPPDVVYGWIGRQET